MKHMLQPKNDHESLKFGLLREMRPIVDDFTLYNIQALLNGYIDAKIPASLRTMVKLTYELNNDELILTEERPVDRQTPWEKQHIARFCWESEQWKVYAPAEGGCTWHTVDGIGPQACFEDLLEQVERDEAGLFWR
ncbi:hypothetical protein PAECIP111890_01850 [Paenibacillus sp. JJ-223]|nr:hypothetical protein PAECIP111890_01850 [Paenibacillus sp. JJ-223]